MRCSKFSLLAVVLALLGACSAPDETPPKNVQNAAAPTNSARTVDEPVTNENTAPAPVSENPSNEDPGTVNNDAANSAAERLANGDLTADEQAQPEFDESLIKQVKYSRLSEAEKLFFIQKRMNHISFLIANEKYYFNTAEDKKAIQIIKYWIDELQKRVGNGGGSKLWSGDLNLLFNRGRKHAPVIIQAAKKRNVPKIVPLYIAAIETEYTNVSGENQAGAAGLFQFIPSTARAYGINPSERTDVPKMADAAARYIGDRMKEFGNDTRSVALCIAGYNRSPDNVRRDLHAVLEITNNREKERSFWTMIENEDSLVRRFGEGQRKYYRENMPYVPRFFAFAIIGETPWAFDVGLSQALSTYEN